MSIDPTKFMAGTARSGWLVTAVARVALAVSLSALAVMTAALVSPQDARGAVPNCATAPNVRAWDGGGGADNGWFTAANWAGDVLPGQNEIACIGDATVNFSVFFSAEVDAVVSGPDGTLSFPGFTVLTLSPQSGEESQVANLMGRPGLAGAGDLTVTKSFNISSAAETIAGPAGSKLTLAPSVGANAPISGIRLDGRTLVVSNGVTVTNPGGIILSSNGASIENSGVWDATADGVILQPAPTSPGSEFRNTATGVLKKTLGAGTTSVKPRVVNDGLIQNLSSGILGLGAFSEGGPDAAKGKVNIAGSGVTLTGSGRLEPGVFQSFGAVAPGASAGTIQVTGTPGSWELGSAVSESPTLQMEIGGTGAGQFDQLALAGAFTLPARFARLELSTLPGYTTPVVGDEFPIVTGSSGFSGTFETVTGTDLGGGKSFQVIYESNRVLVRVVGPDPAPTVTINQAAGQADPTSTSPILFDVLFSEPVTGFTGSDVSFAGSTAGGTLAASVSGSGASYQVSVSGMTSSGDVVASLPAGAAMDTAGNSSSASTSTDNRVTWVAPDTTGPSVTINQAAGQADPTSTSPILFDVLFSEPVTGFTGSDVSFAGSTAGGTLAASVSGSGASYQVSVSGMTSSGDVVASLPAGAAMDTAGNSSSASTSTDNRVTFNQQAPPQAPSCNGVAATIYVGADGRIVGGPDNGTLYRGKLNGTPGADVMVGTAGSDEFAARGGNDRLCGREGNDELEGGGGHDALFGEGGNDELDAGGGNDTMTGGLGADKFRGGSGTDTATDFRAAEGDTKTGVEVVL
jgi:hypothetical protein